MKAKAQKRAQDDDRFRGTRAWLLARGAELRERVERVRADLRRERDPLPRDFPDAAIIVENDEVLQAIESSSRAELSCIEHALERMDAGMFALCETCAEPIEPKRLEAVPYATRCGHCEPT